MVMFVRYGLILFVLKLWIITGYGERTKDRMYIDIEASISCFRRFNATHQIGCSSKRSGATGVVHFCLNEKDLQFILRNGSAGPYIPVVPVSLLTIQTIKILKGSSKISGLLLYMNNETLSSFTHDLQCPNQKFQVENTCSRDDRNKLWNPHGTGLLFENIRFPVFYIDRYKDISAVMNCFQKFNNYSYETQRDRSLCSVQLNSFMYGAKNTPTCIRRSNIATNLNPIKVCDPLGDKNVWASLFPLATFDTSNKEIKPIVGQKYIVIAARMDTGTMFERTTGADSPITGLVTLLTIARKLKLILPRNQNYGKNVLFILFNGETFDYIGSQRLLYDMERGNFPVETENGTAQYFPVIKVEDISLFVELSQLSRGDGTVVVHRYKVDEKNSKFTKLLQDNMVPSVNLETSNGTLPPSSVHTFIRKSANLSAVLLTNHKGAYTNAFYNSIFDNSANVAYKYFNGTKNNNTMGDSLQKHILDVATSVSHSVYQEVTGDAYKGLDEDLLELVDELLHCYLENQTCKVFQAVGKQPTGQEYPLNLYVGVDTNTNDATTFLGLVLGWLTGDIVGESNKNCTNMSKNYAFRFYNMSANITNLNVTMCFRMVMNFTEAVSPAFIIDDYDWSSNAYSTWSESTWGEINMRLFLKPSAAHESTMIALGCIFVTFSFFVVYFAKSRSHVLFTAAPVRPPPVDC